MTPDKLKTMTPLKRLLYFVREREAVRLKKEAGERPPWTQDPILQSYRFTNVRRMDDKVSRWLLKNWYKPYRNHPNMLAAAAIARFFNLPSTLHCITGLVFNPDGPPDLFGIYHAIKALRNAGYTVFNCAYMVRGNDGDDKIESVLEHNVRPLMDADRRERIVAPSSMERTHANITAVRGYGSFMAGQLVADLRHAVTGRWRDKHTWAPIGPGSRRGMNRLHGRDKDAPLSQDQFLNELMALRGRMLKTLPEVAGRLEAMDVQNCLCEFSKFEKALFGEGRPKELYNPYRPKYVGVE